MRYLLGKKKQFRSPSNTLLILTACSLKKSKRHIIRRREVGHGGNPQLTHSKWFNTELFVVI